MKEYLKNLINQPSQVKAGQVWKIYDIKVLVVDDRYADKGIVRVLVVSDLTILNDGIDIILPKNDRTRFKDYTTLRVTQCAIPIDSLELFIEEIESDLLDKIKMTLHIQDFDYLESELKIINLYNEILEEHKNRAIKKYEETNSEIYASKTPIYNVSAFVYGNSEPFRLALAASDDSLLSGEQFFELERENRDKSFLILDDDLALIRLTPVKGNLYLVIYAKKKININDIRFSQNDVEFPSLEKEFNISPNGLGFSAFDLKNYKKEDAIISFKINGKEIKKNIRIK